MLLRMIGITNLKSRQDSIVLSLNEQTLGKTLHDKMKLSLMCQLTAIPEMKTNRCDSDDQPQITRRGDDASERTDEPGKLAHKGVLTLHQSQHGA